MDNECLIITERSLKYCTATDCFEATSCEWIESVKGFVVNILSAYSITDLEELIMYGGKHAKPKECG